MYDYDSMSIEELELLLQHLDLQAGELREAKRTTKQVLTEKRALQSAQYKLDRMSDAEREALHQIVSVKGAKSVGDGKVAK